MNIRELNELNSYIELVLAPPIRDHGGDIKLLEVEDRKLVLELTGACTLCPADTMTKKGLELQLKSKFTSIEEVQFERSSDQEFKLSL